MATASFKARLFKSPSISIIKHNFSEGDFMTSIEWTTDKTELFKRAWQRYIDGKCSRKDIAELMYCSINHAVDMAERLGLQTKRIDGSINTDKLREMGLA